VDLTCGLSPRPSGKCSVSKVPSGDEFRAIAMRLESAASTLTTSLSPVRGVYEQRPAHGGVVETVIDRTMDALATDVSQTFQALQTAIAEARRRAIICDQWAVYDRAHAAYLDARRGWGNGGDAPTTWRPSDPPSQRRPSWVNR